MKKPIIVPKNDVMNLTTSFSQHSFGQPEIPVDTVPLDNSLLKNESKQNIKIGLNTSLELSISNSSNPNSQRDLHDLSQKLI